ncbi:MAG: hypothetical protein JW751_02250 [Polyangiaceae bacterium]|nr:hypothetical protein [Polyangiaceae bacterium]
MLLIPWLLLGCEPEDPTTGDCSYEPTYHMMLSATEGVVPEGTVISVAYGGGCEEYTVGGPSTAHQQLFCEGVGASTIEAGRIGCDVWVSGPAVVKVVPPGHVPVLRAVAPLWEDGCIVTQEVVVVLGEDELTVGD